MVNQPSTVVNLPSKPGRSGRDLPRPPRHLEPSERKLWNQLVAGFDFRDSASQAVLRTALEAHQRSRRCREAIDRDGEAVRDRFDQIKPHPLLPAERDGRAAFLQGMRALNLDIGSTK
jgi:phage terminase small subunit